MKLKKLNKKGAFISSGLYFILVVVYFFFFILIVNSSEQISNFSESDSNLVTIDLGSVEFKAIIGSSFCTNPRQGYDATNGESFLYTNAENDRLFCEESIGIKGSTLCNYISGCSWENITSGWWFWESTESASCIGDINSSEYGIDKNEPLFGRPRVKPHNNTGYWDKYTPFSDPSVCEHPNVLENKTLCDLFSCSWETATADSTFNSVGSVYSTVSEVFTFRYDFGFKSQSLSLFMNFIFVVLPLLLLIISIYFMLPVIH